VVKPFTVIVIALHVANRPCSSTVAMWAARAQQSKIRVVVGVVVVVC